MKRIILIFGQSGEPVTRQPQKDSIASAAIYISGDPDRRADFNDPGVRLVMEPDGTWKVFEMAVGGSVREPDRLVAEGRVEPPIE